MKSEEPTTTGKLRKLRLLIVGAAVCLSLGQITPWLGDLHWSLELVCHFQIQFAFAAVALLLLAWLVRVRRELPWLILPCLLGIFHLSPYYLEHKVPAADLSDETSLKIISYNVLSSNTRHEDALNFLIAQNADVIALYEVNSAWADAIDSRLNEFQGPMHQREDNFGISLISRWPIEIIHFESPDASGVPLLHARITLPGGPVEVIACHPVPPGTSENLQSRDIFIDRAAELAGSATDPVLMVGDFNLSRWSPTYQRLLTKSNLANCRDGRGLKSTWFPRMIPLGFLPGLEIDHALLGPEFSVKSYTVGPKHGSDHSPLILEVALKPAERSNTP